MLTSNSLYNYIGPTRRVSWAFPLRLLATSMWPLRDILLIIRCAGAMRKRQYEIHSHTSIFAIMQCIIMCILLAPTHHALNYEQNWLGLWLGWYGHLVVLYTTKSAIGLPVTYIYNGWASLHVYNNNKYSSIYTVLRAWRSISVTRSQLLRQLLRDHAQTVAVWKTVALNI